MTERFRPYGLSRLAVIALAAALVGAGVTYPLFPSSFGASDLRDVVMELRLALPLLAVPLGWLAVWAMRVHTPDSVLVGPAPGLTRNLVVARQVALLSGAVLIGLVVGAAPVTITAWSSQHWSAADLVSLVGVLVAAVSLIPIAAAAAMLVGPRVGLFIAPAVVLAVLLIPAFVINDHMLKEPASILGVSYMWSLSYPSRGEMLVWQIELLRIGFFLLVGFCALKVVAGLAEWRAARQPRGVASLGWCLPPIAVAVVVGLTSPTLAVPDPGDQVRCAQQDNFALCLYQIDEPHREFITQVLEPMTALTHPDQADTLTITQGYIPEDLVGSFLGVDRIGGARADWITGNIRNNVYGMIYGAHEECETATYDGQSTRTSVAYQLLSRAGERAATPEIQAAYLDAAEEGGAGANPEADARLDALTDDEFVEWFSVHHEAITECRLTPADLP